tara:strand:- start:537 stop:695 length:159 start_codon:yes stop_codon:yes gene_type:complete
MQVIKKLDLISAFLKRASLSKEVFLKLALASKVTLEKFTFFLKLQFIKPIFF